MNTCRFCLNPYENIQLTLLSSTCTISIELVLPEIDLNLTEAPQICSVCLNSLEDAYNFKKKCLESEEQLKSIKNVKIKCEIEGEDENDAKNCFEAEYEKTKNNNDNINTFNLESGQQIGNVQWIKQEIEETFETTIPFNQSIQSETDQEIENTMIKNEIDIEIGENEVISLENHSNSNLNYSQKNKNYPNRYKCNQCEKSYPFKSRLLYHMINHSDEKKNICEICGKGFHLPTQLKIHINNVHSNVKIIPYQCSDCGIKFDENENLVDINTQKCYNCQGKIIVKLETDRNKLDNKVLEKPCECNICGKKYVSNSSLQRHKMIHSGEIRISCEICGKGFKQMSELKSHAKTHENRSLKPYKCKECGNRFLKIPYLQRHKRVYCRGNKSNSVIN